MRNTKRRQEDDSNYKDRIVAPSIILYYLYVDVGDAAALRETQEKLCRKLELCGRIRVALEGLNGTLAGAPRNIDMYISAMREDVRFGAVDFKRSSSSTVPFPGLLVKNVRELVSSDGQLAGVKGPAGIHVTPEEWHGMLAFTHPAMVERVEERSAKG